MQPSVIILTFNSENSIQATLQRALLASVEVIVVDSFSSDSTASIAAALGVRVVTHPFESYSAQRNWAIDNLPLHNSWQLHLDADEWMSDQLIQAIRSLPDNPTSDGFLIPRYLKFLGRVLKHGAMSPTWHLRLFRSGAARCEARKYDQHFYLKEGKPDRLSGHIIDDIQMPLSEWTARHNRWSDAEAEELTTARSSSAIRAKVFGNPIEQKRFWRDRYNSMPLFVRPYALFCYRYFLRLGILDGREGLVFWMLQTFWFRFLIDAKLFERSKLKYPPARGIAPAAPVETNVVSAP